MAFTAWTGSYSYPAPAQDRSGPTVSYSIYSFLSPANAAVQNGGGKGSDPTDLHESTKPSKANTTRSGCHKNSKPLSCCNTNTSGSTWRRGQRRSDGSISLRRREQNRRAQSRFRAKRRASRGKANGKASFPKEEEEEAKPPQPSRVESETPLVIVPIDDPLSSAAPALAVPSRNSFDLSPPCAPAPEPYRAVLPTEHAPLSSSWPSLSPPMSSVELPSVPFMSPLRSTLATQGAYSQAVLTPAMPVLPSFPAPGSSPPLNCGVSPPPPAPAPGAPLDSASAPASLKNDFMVGMLYPGPWFPCQWEGC